MTRQIEKVVVQEYGPEHADELVAFSDIRRTEQDITLAYVHLGQIGPDGARYSYEAIEGGGKGTWSDSIFGFGDFVGVELGWDEQGTLRHVHGDMKQKSSHFAGERQFAGSLHDKPDVGYGNWYLGRGAIVEGLRQELEAINAPWAFSAIYYNLARLAEGNVQLASPSMIPETTKQLDIAGNLRNALAGAIRLNTMLQRDLTIFGKVPQSAVADHYASVRRGSRAAINTALESADESPLAWYYPRIDVYAEESELTADNVVGKLESLPIINKSLERPLEVTREIAARMRSLHLLERGLAIAGEEV